MKKFLVTLLVAMLALTAVALADGAYEVDSWWNHLNTEHNGSYNATQDPYAIKNLETPDYFKLPTCTEQGYCKHDNGPDADDDIVYHLEPLGHKWNDGEITHGNCTEGATLTQKCTRAWRPQGKACGEIKTSTITTTHKYGTVVVQKRTCVDALITYEGCVDCGQPKGVKQLFTWWVGGEAGDTKKIDGVTYYFGGDDYAPYDLPNTTKNEADINAVHKLLSPWVTTEIADCVTPGVKYRACPYCGFEQTDVLPKLNHSFADHDGLPGEDNCGKNKDHDKDVVTLNVNIANCKTVALYLDVEYCEHEGCDAYLVHKPTNHSGSYGYAIDKDLPGVKEAYEAIDGMYDDDELANIYYEAESINGQWVAVKGHHIPDMDTYKETVIKAQSCKPYADVRTDDPSKANYGWYVIDCDCSVCGKEVTELTFGGANQYYKQGEHTYGEWEHLFDASEDSDFVSYWRRQCSVCLQYQTSVEGPCGKYNHQAAAPVKENVVKATFTAAGSYEDVVYCSVCGIELSRDEKVEPMKEGLNPADGKIWDDGKAIEGTGMVEFNGGKFYVVDGVLQNAMGVTNVGDKFLFLAHGQLQDVTQLAEYDGEWFYVVNGEVQVGFNGLVEYDGAKFLVGAGRVQFEQTTLFNDGTQWVLISAGQVATSYTGAFTYDGVVFQVVNGIVK